MEGSPPVDEVVLFNLPLLYKKPETALNALGGAAEVAHGLGESHRPHPPSRAPGLECHCPAQRASHYPAPCALSLPVSADSMTVRGVLTGVLVFLPACVWLVYNRRAACLCAPSFWPWQAYVPARVCVCFRA